MKRMGPQTAILTQAKLPLAKSKESVGMDVTLPKGVQAGNLILQSHCKALGARTDRPISFCQEHNGPNPRLLNPMSSTLP